MTLLLKDIANRENVWIALKIKEFQKLEQKMLLILQLNIKMKTFQPPINTQLEYTAITIRIYIHTHIYNIHIVASQQQQTTTTLLY